MSVNDSVSQKSAYLYEIVCNDIIAMIRTRGLRAHDPLPSEGTIAQMYTVSRMTGKLALKSLEEQGIVYRVSRRGSFLADGFEEKMPAGIIAETGRDRSSHGRQLSIALVVPSLDLYVGDLIRSIQEAADKRSIRVFLHFTDEDPAEEDRVLAEMSRLAYIHGIILFPLSRGDVSRRLLEMKLNGYPLVLVDRTFEHLALDSVIHAHYDGTHAITTFLIDRGHRNIGFVSQPLKATRSREQRYQGYIHALMDHGVPVRKEQIQIIESDIHTIHGVHILDSPALPVLHEYLGSNRAMTAVVCGEDYTALEVYYAAIECGLRVPDDLSIVGFADNRALRFAPVRLTTLRQPLEEMGEKALDLIVQRIAEPKREYSEVVIEAEIVSRDTVANLRRDIN